ncbi:signal peptidase I [Candidatus Woesearchaeota archaeon]|nr:signal peptidase I [Candidatus Woesearchaeota archaeon]
MNKEFKKLLKKVWYFIWEDDSIWSWIANIILAFVIIKFVVYPGLGFLLSTSHPVVAVVSSSMEHNAVPYCAKYNDFEVLNKDIRHCVEYSYSMCGNAYDKKKSFDLDEYWEECGGWYESNTGITKSQFSGFSFKNGFNKGDIMVLVGRGPENIAIGDVVVFRSNKEDPIIHRVVKESNRDREIYFQTKGDNNKESIKNSALDETSVGERVIIGKAVLRVPLLGYIKIWFTQMIKFLGFA